ncbi:MAG: tyrosine-protein phosphatase [Gemmataceae bacterium]
MVVWLSRAVWFLQAVLLGTGLALALHFALILATPNLHPVVPGQIYRAAQPHPDTLARLVAQQGIRSVINLRGCCPHLDWYRKEADATATLDLDQVDIAMSAARLPAAWSVRQLIEALDRTPKPLLLHCQQGVDRTGLASAVALLLYTQTPLDQARRHMSLEMGHVRLGRTRHIGRFFDYYASWLADLKMEHSPAVFRYWATTVYCPGEARVQWSLVAGSTALSGYRPAVLTVRAVNRSILPWKFTSSRNAGIHGYWYLESSTGEPVTAGIMGLFERVIPPTEGVDLEVIVPPLGPGRYHLLIELLDEQHASFVQLGDEGLALELVVS